MFRFIKPQLAIDEERGLSWMSLSEQLMRYSAGDHVLLLPWGRGVWNDGSFVCIVLTGSDLRWQPPHEHLAIGVLELEAIKAQIDEAARTLGYRVCFEQEGPAIV